MRTPPSPFQNERWLPVVGYEGAYEVSDHGRVRSLTRTSTFEGRRGGQLVTITRSVAARLLVLTVDRGPAAYGRRQVKLSADGEARTRLVHHLVAEAFIGPRPAGLEVAHGDGDASNNRVSNLRYATPLENASDKRGHGTAVSVPSKLPPDVVREIRSARPAMTYQAIADRYEISIAHAWRVANGQRCQVLA